MEEYKETLQDMIKKLLSGQWSVPKFKAEFYMFYLEEVPGEVLSDDEWRFYSAIHEGLDRTAAAPGPLSRQSGWMNYQEYIEWVRHQLRQLVEKRRSHQSSGWIRY